LRTAIEDTTVPIVERLPAADALAQCGTAERAAAERGLRSVLDDPMTTARRRREAAHSNAHDVS
jgi:hypothetical protein